MLKRLLAVLSVAASVVPAAYAAFPSNQRVDSTVSVIAGRPAHVVCYNDDAAWDARVRDAFHGAVTGPQIRAFTYPGKNPIEVSPPICRTLYYALRVGPAKVSKAKLGAVIDVISHEPNHVAGLADEAQTEACARRYFGFTTHSLFPTVTYHSALMRTLTAAALDYSRSLPSTYQGATCPR